MNILVASDLSDRSRLALQRGVEIARNIGVTLPVLYVIDEDFPQRIRAVIESGARAEISEQLADLAPHLGQGETLVRTGGIVAAILEEIESRNIELLIMGGNRRQKQNVFTGTTIERVMRARRAPVLCVKNLASRPYEKILVALDLTESTGHQILQTGERLELFANKNVILAHAFTPIPGDLLDYAGVQDEARRRRYIATQEDALQRLSEIKELPELQTSIVRCIAGEGKPFEVIRQLVESQQPDLVVMGTQGHEGLRWLLGSVTEQALRELETDMLIIPIR